MNINPLIEKLNDKNIDCRLDALREIKKLTDHGLIEAPKLTDYVNNHIHTIYSFSPYSPTKAVYMAWQAGLKTAGIMDHDTLGGAKEFIEAAKIVDLPVTVGFETRVNMESTKLNGKRINNPDQTSVAYVAMHGVPNQHIDELNIIFAKYRARRNIRNRKMCQNITKLVEPYGLSLDFDEDVYPLSEYENTGTITERHILYGLTKKVTAKYKTPEEVVNFFKNDMKINISGKIESQILDGANHPEFYEYDILGALKGNMVEKFYIPATDELPSVEEFVKLASKYGAISAYAYLGDVKNSVTGDKKAQSFEDGYLDLLFDELRRLDFNAVTYMPTRNTPEQLKTIMEYCDKYSFFQISGVDINSPRQKFICEELNNPMYSHLIDATYALIGAERAATGNIEQAMFSEYVKIKIPNIKDRIQHYKRRSQM